MQIYFEPIILSWGTHSNSVHMYLFVLDMVNKIKILTGMNGKAKLWPRAELDINRCKGLFGNNHLSQCDWRYKLWANFYCWRCQIWGGNANGCALMDGGLTMGIAMEMLERVLCIGKEAWACMDKTVGCHNIKCCGHDSIFPSVLLPCPTKDLCTANLK